MESIKQFNKGLNKDSSNEFQPSDTAKSLKHWVQISQDGDVYSLINEKGVTDLTSGIPSGFKLIGYTVLNTDIIVVLAHSLGYSQIGIIDYNKKYTRIVPSTDTGSQLGFSVDHPVDCVAKKTYNGERILYYTDNNVPFGSLNLDNPPSDSSLTENTKLIKDLDVPVVTPIKISNTGGALYCGAYQFSIRYINEDTSSTPVVGITQPVPIVDESTGSTYKEKDGGASDKLTSKSIVLKISNIDLDYKQIQIIVHRYSNDGNVLNSYALSPVSVNDDTIEYVFSSIDNENEKLDIAEVRETLISYNKAKCIEQVDNRLLLANLSETTNEFDQELQEIANNIVTKYEIREEPYLFSENPVIDFDLIGCWGDFSGDFPQTIGFTFTDLIDKSPNLSSFKAYPDNQPSTGTIIVVDPTNLVGDTLTIDGEIYNFVASLTNPNDILVDVGSTTNTANNIKTILESNVVTSNKFYISILSATITLNYKYPGDDTFLITTSATTPTELNITNVAGGASLASIEFNPTNISIVDNKATCTFGYTDLTGPIYYFKVDALNNAIGNDTYTSSSFSNAVSTEINYDIESIITSNPSLGYKDETFTTYLKGFKRNEVYSLGLKVTFKDSADSYVYHIPGSNMSTNNTTQAIPDNPGTIEGNTTGMLGTYLSSIEYPLNQFLPGTRDGDDKTVNGVTVSNDKIRHHVMPTLIQEPITRYKPVTSGGILSYNQIYIRILGLSFEFNLGFSTNLASKIQSFSIVRESREIQGNKSIISQGIGIPMHSCYSAYDYNDATPSEPVNIKSPYFGPLTVSSNTRGGKPESILADVNGQETSLLAYYSPDTILGNVTAADLEGKDITCVAGMTGIANNITDEESLSKNERYKRSIFRVTSVDPIVGDSYSLHRLYNSGVLWQSIFFRQLYLGTGAAKSIPNTSTVATISSSHSIDRNVIKSVSGVTNPIYNSDSSEFLLLKTSTKSGYIFDSVSSGADVGTELYFNCNALYLADDGDVDDIESFDEYTNDALSISINILEIKNELNNQYGGLDNSEYLNCETSYNIQTTPFTLSNVYGGDIFISPFSVTNKQFLPIHTGRILFDSAVIGSATLSVDDYEIRGGNPHDENREPVKGFDSRCLYNIILESNINSDFRNEFEDDSGIQTRYYPKSDGFTTLKNPIEKGECISYNSQYSIENAVKTFFSKSSQGSTEGDFSNRIIYSDNSSLDSVIDNYQQFPINNYQDIPKHTGEIWDLFVLNDNVYIHTPKSLWRAYSKNNTNMVSSDISEVVLGTGDAFTIDAKQRVDFKGGYAGSISQFAGVHTPAGYIFPDALQGKVFLFDGNNLQEISRQGLVSEFNNKFKTNIIDSGNYIDNPYNGYGFLGGYDFTLKRYLLTKKDSVGGLTYSYSFIGNCWLSEHDYRPDAYISLDNNIYMMDNANSIIYEANTGDYGNFLTLLAEKAKSSISFILNDNVNMTKTFDNLVFKTNSYNINNVYIPDNTFNSLLVNNNMQNTSEKTIIVDNNYRLSSDTVLQAKYLNDEYRLYIPRDFEGKRFKGKYCIITLTYNNENNYKFVTNYIKGLYRINSR